MKFNYSFSIILIITFLALQLLSCERANPLDCTKNTGEILRQERHVMNDISAIVLQDNVNLVLTQAEMQKVEIEAGKNLIDKIKTEMQHDTLYISNVNYCNWVRNYEKEITAYIDIVNLEHIVYKGSGDIRTTNSIEAPNFQLDVWEGAGEVRLDLAVKNNSNFLHIGTADVIISGTASWSYLSSESYGVLDTRNLISSCTYVSSSSSNHTYVSAFDVLEATVLSIGNIYYSGTPNVISINEESGGGKVLPLD